MAIFTINSKTSPAQSLTATEITFAYFKSKIVPFLENMDDRIIDKDLIIRFR